MVAARRGETTRARSGSRASTATARCAAAPTATTPPPAGSRRSRPTAATCRRMPQNQRTLHWAQAGSTAGCCARSAACERLDVALVYFDIATQDETVLVESYSAPPSCAPSSSCSATASSPGPRRRPRTAARATPRWRRCRFPTPTSAPASASWPRASTRPRSPAACLLAQAPTGIGKTVGTLFPHAQGHARRRSSTSCSSWPPRRPGRALRARGAARTIAAAPAPSAARCAAARADRTGRRATRPASIPTRPATATRARSPRASTTACPPRARPRSARRPSRAATRPRAACARWRCAHEVCPYYLAQEMVRWGDVVVGDYNYYFDLGAHAARAGARPTTGASACWSTRRTTWSPRAREMYSATLSRAALDGVRPRAPATVAPALKRLARTLERDRRPAARAVRRARGPAARPASPRCRTSTRRSRDHSADASRRTPPRELQRSTSTRCTSRAWPNPSARTRCST